MTDSDLVRAGRTLADMETKSVSRWSLSYTGNRVMLAVLLGLIAFVTTRSLFGTVSVALIAFVVATVWFKPRR